MKVVFCGANIKRLKNGNPLPDFLKLIKFGVIVQENELHKIVDNIL